MRLLQRKVCCFVAIKWSWLTIMLWQGAIKSLVVAPLFLGQLSAGLWQRGIPWQGDSYTLGAPGSVNFCSLCPQHHWLWLVHSPRPLGSSLRLKGRALHGDLWRTVAAQHPLDSSSLCLQHNAAQEMSLSEKYFRTPSEQAVMNEGFTIFCYEWKSGIILILPSGLSWRYWAQFL